MFLKHIIAIKSQICVKHYPQKYETNCIRPASIRSPDLPATTHPKPPPFNICFIVFYAFFSCRFSKNQFKK